MPILPRETDIFPDDLLAQEPGQNPSAAWWATYTLPRREKDLMRRLRQLEVPFYGPVIMRRTRSPGGRQRESFVPLFPGYVFVQATSDQRYQAMTTNCVSRCLEVPSPNELVHDLRQIRQLIASDAPLTPEARLEPGMRVRVRSGALVGLEGTVIKRHGTQRLLVTVQFLQQGASVLLEDYEVERIDQ